MSGLPSSQAPADTVTVRRHHTITAASRTAHSQAKDIISEETTPSEQTPWNDDDLVDHDWVGGVGAVGEKTSLHRQASLPTRYHRGFHGSSSGTPKTAINSLVAIAGHEGDEEPWTLAEYSGVQDDVSWHFCEIFISPDGGALSLTAGRRATIGSAGDQFPTLNTLHPAASSCSFAAPIRRGRS